MEATQFLRNFTAIVPYHIHTILTDNGIQFTNRKKDKWAFIYIFDRICHDHHSEHRLTKVNHPWMDGQVEAGTHLQRRYSKTLTVKAAIPGENLWRRYLFLILKKVYEKYFQNSLVYKDYNLQRELLQLKEHLYNFLNAYNFAKRLKTLQRVLPLMSTSLNVGKKNLNTLSLIHSITLWD